MLNGSRPDANPESLLAEPQPLAPKCPHCKADPARIAATFMKMGGGILMVVFCGSPSCRKIHSVFPVAFPSQSPEPERALWTPSA